MASGPDVVWSQTVCEHQYPGKLPLTGPVVASQDDQPYLIRPPGQDATRVATCEEVSSRGAVWRSVMTAGRARLTTATGAYCAQALRVMLPLLGLDKAARGPDETAHSPAADEPAAGSVVQVNTFRRQPCFSVLASARSFEIPLPPDHRVVIGAQASPLIDRLIP